MARKRRSCPPGVIFHLCNRAAGQLILFQKPSDYLLVLRVFQEAAERFPVFFFAYCIMPNHWHLLAQAQHPKAISQFQHWFGTTHAKRWRSSQGSLGRGAVYQGRFRSHPVRGPLAFLRTAAYIERNALAAGLVSHAADWPWGSASQRADLPLTTWPHQKPNPWKRYLAKPLDEESLRQIQYAQRSSTVLEINEHHRGDRILVAA